MRTIISLIAMLCLGWGTALANGYDTYSAPIAWSPDSSMLCAVIGADWPQPQVANQGVVLVYDQYGRIQYDLGLSDAGSPAWSPDGKYLAYIANGQVLLHETEGFELVDVVDLEGSGLDLAFVGSAQDYELGYSVGPRFYGASLVRQALEGGDWSELPKPNPGDSAISLRMHPASGRLAFLLQGTGADDPAYERIFTIDANGNPSQMTKAQLREWDYHESNISFMPDGRLLFQRGGWGDWHIKTLEPDSGRELLLVPDAQQPSCSADGRLLAFTRRSYLDKAQAEYDWEIPPGVWVRELATGHEWRVSDNENEAEHPVISPDGRKLAWLQRMESEPRLMVRSVIGFTGVLGSGDGETGNAGTAAPVMDEPMLADEFVDPEAGIDSTAEQLSPKAMEIDYVKFTCTNGDILFAVHHEWNPLGAQRFIELVNEGFYDGAPWFRVIEGFVAQCGISTEPEANAAWKERTIADEPVYVGNERGMVAFGKSGLPDSRTTHIFINLADNSAHLDEQGFAAFAEVIGGMATVDGLERVQFNQQGELAAEGGMGMFSEEFPDADYILEASVVDSIEASGVAIDDTGMEQQDMPAEVSYVKFECTNGDIVFAVHPDWDARGAEHFLELVRMGFYDGAPWFRVIEDWVAQCGISADWRMNEQWGEATFEDSPVLQSNTRGMVAYGKTEDPDSRSTHIYINFGDNSRLDAKGFSPFAEVVLGMDVADALHRCEFEDQDALAAEGGMAQFREMFPDADYIELAYIMDGPPQELSLDSAEAAVVDE